MAEHIMLLKWRIYAANYTFIIDPVFPKVEYRWLIAPVTVTKWTKYSFRASGRELRHFEVLEGVKSDFPVGIQFVEVLEGVKSDFSVGIQFVNMVIF